MSFGEKLKKIRLDRNLTLSEVSKAIDIGKSSLSEYENDITRPSLDKFFRIIEFYHVNENYFYGDTHVFLDLSTLSDETKEKSMQFLHTMKFIKNNIKIVTFIYEITIF